MSGFITNPDKASSSDTSLTATPSGDTASNEKSNDNNATTSNEVRNLEDRLRNQQSYDQKRLNDKDVVISKLEKELSAKSLASLPSSEEELTKFAEDNPALYPVLERMMSKKAMETESTLGKQLQEVDKKTNELRFKEANKDLLVRHPDAESIKVSTDFLSWVSTQPQYTINILTSSDATVDDLSFVLDKYKAEKGLVNTSESDKKQQQKEGAEAVTNPDK